MMVEYKITPKLTEEVIDELLSLSKNNELSAEIIVEKAKDKNNPLHDLFEWNDTEAAHSFRLYQARVLVNEVRVVIDNQEYYAFENVVVKASISNNGSQTQTLRLYKPVVEILSDEEMRKQVVRAALNHLSYWERQNAKYSELSPIVKAAAKVRRKLELNGKERTDNKHKAVKDRKTKA